MSGTVHRVGRCPAVVRAPTLAPMEPEHLDTVRSGPGELDQLAPQPRPGGAVGWLKSTNRNPGVIAFVTRARQMLPGDPAFGDPLSMSGDAGPRAAARAADRLLGDRDAASREVSLAGLQVWQALTERVSRRPVTSEV